MKYYVVIDTNVLVSALMKPESIPGVILEEALSGRIMPLLNSEILDEYEEVLSRRKFKFDHRDIRVAIDGLVRRAAFVDAAPVDAYIPDTKDVVSYALTMEKRNESDEEAYLVTGNQKHFPIRPFVVTPRQMVDILNEGDS